MRLMRKMIVAGLLAGIVSIASAADHPAPAAGAAKGPTPAEALHKLVDGNGRFIMGAATGKGRDESRRAEVAKGQHPFAAVLTCADSRVPAEVVFDVGLGDIFTVRVAGNTAENSEMASLEYAIEHLHTPVIIVMGHTKCGAVAAALAGGKLPPHIARLIENIKPAAEEAKVQNPGLTGDALAVMAVKRNVLQSIKVLLSESDIVREAVEAGKIQVVGAVYDLQTGKADIIGEHPRQLQIMAAAQVRSQNEAKPAEKAAAKAEEIAPAKETAKEPATVDARPHDPHAH